jgi:voltage-gated potassium channel
MQPEHRHSFIAIIDDIAMMMLAFVSAILLGVELLIDLPPELAEAIMALDLAIAFIFCLEFVVRFTLSRNRPLFMKEYWWELLAAIPLSSEVVQAFRVLRLVRVVRLTLHIRAVWKDAHAIGEYRIT